MLVAPLPLAYTALALGAYGLPYWRSIYGVWIPEVGETSTLTASLHVTVTVTVSPTSYRPLPPGGPLISMPVM